MVKAAGCKEILRKSHLFDGISEVQLDRIEELCREEFYRAGETIFTEGMPATDVYIVKRGKIALDANFSARPGAEKRGTVDVALENEAFGWSAIAGSGPLTLSARAIEDSQVLTIDGAGLRSLLDQDRLLGHMVMHEALAIALSRLNRTKETLASILSIASHDLKAPLNAVQSYLRVLLGGFFGEINDKQREVLSRCSERLAEFSELIDNILDITRFEEGTLPMEPTSLAGVVRDSVELLRTFAARRGILLNLELSPAEPIVLGSPLRLKQVMNNLLGNAIKFTLPGGEVLVRLEQKGAEARIEVCDTGLGISPEDLPRVFDEFYQGSAAESAEGSGAEIRGVGLGLSICRKIIAAHHGRIWAESPCPETGRGSKFIVTLPRDGRAASSEKAGVGKDRGTV